MAGGLLISTGMVAASFSQRVYHMYISIGVISGECVPLLGSEGLCVLHLKKGGGKVDPNCISSSPPPFFSFKLIMSEISDFFF